MHTRPLLSLLDVSTVLSALPSQRAGGAGCLQGLPQEDSAADGDLEEGLGRLRSPLHQRECSIQGS